MDAGGRRWGLREPRVPRHAGRMLLASLTALRLGMPLLLASAAGMLVGAGPGWHATDLRVAHAAPIATSPTATISPTAPPTTPVVQPQFALVSPSSAQGPAGAHITLSGSSWTHSSVTIGAAQASANCGTASSWSTTFGTVQPSSGGAFSFTFVWPVALGNTSAPYAICATSDAGVASTSYHVLVDAPPILSFSGPTVQVGAAVTVSGSNFYAGQVALTVATANGGSRPLATIAPNSDGTFSYPYVAAAGDVGTVDIVAQTPSESGAAPALQASAAVIVQATPSPTATATATPDPTPTATAAATATATSTGGHPAPLGNGLLILLAIGLLLALLLVIGAIIFLVLRRGGGDDTPGGPGSPPSTPGGYGTYNDFGASGQFHRSGVQRMDEETVRTPVGRVSQWDAPTAGPGPEWSPRPMSGIRTWSHGAAAGAGGPAGPQPPNDFPGAPDYPTEPSAQRTPDPWRAPWEQQAPPIPGAGPYNPDPREAANLNPSDPPPAQAPPGRMSSSGPATRPQAPGEDTLPWLPPPDDPWQR